MVLNKNILFLIRKGHRNSKKYIFFIRFKDIKVEKSIKIYFLYIFDDES